MPDYDFSIVYEKLAEIDPADEVLIECARETDEIEDLRRFAAELSDPEPIVLTIS